MTKPTGNPVGRPKKKKNPVGRPKGEATVMKEYRQRMLNSPRSAKVLDAIFEVALDTEHKHWPAAVKMIADRVLPVSGFEKEAGGSGRTKMVVEIKDAGVVQVSSGSPSEEPEEQALEADFEEIKDVEKSRSGVTEVRPRVVFDDPPPNGLHEVTDE